MFSPFEARVVTCLQERLSPLFQNLLIFVLAIAQQGTLQRFFGDDERVDVKKLLEKANYMPYTLILHGDEDSAVPIADNIEWTEAAKKKFGDNSIDLYVEPGGEHGFDCAVPLGTPWLSERLAKITELWLDTKEQ